MNSKGEYTDWNGHILKPGSRVNMALDNQRIPHNAPGVVVSLPPEGNDWHTFPRVNFGAHGTHHVPDTSLEKVQTPRLHMEEPSREETDTPEVAALLDLISARQEEVHVAYALACLLRQAGSQTSPKS